MSESAEDRNPFAPPKTTVGATDADRETSAAEWLGIVILALTVVPVVVLTVLLISLVGISMSPSFLTP